MFPVPFYDFFVDAINFLSAVFSHYTEVSSGVIFIQQGHNRIRVSSDTQRPPDAMMRKVKTMRRLR
jgi:hypothetical protein